MAELLTNLELKDYISLVSLIIGFGGGWFTASVNININKTKQVQKVKSGNAFQAGGDIHICKK